MGIDCTQTTVTLTERQLYWLRRAVEAAWEHTDERVTDSQLDEATPLWASDRDHYERLDDELRTLLGAAYTDASHRTYDDLPAPALEQ